MKLTYHPLTHAVLTPILTQLHQSRRMARESFQQWFFEALWRKRNAPRRYCAVTLSCKQGIALPGGGIEKLTREKTSKAVTVFLKNLNKHSFGAAYRRYGKCSVCISAIEVSQAGRLHVHMLLERPLHEDFKDFSSRIQKTWTALRWAHRQIKVDALETWDDIDGWTKYIVKDMDASADVLDIPNLHI